MFKTKERLTKLKMKNRYASEADMCVPLETESQSNEQIILES